MNTGSTDLRDTEVQQPKVDGHLVLGEQLARLLGEQRPVRGRIDDHRLESMPITPPLALISSIVISAVSFSAVSEIAIVPDSECRTPTLIGVLSWPNAVEIELQLRAAAPPAWMNCLRSIPLSGSSSAHSPHCSAIQVPCHPLSVRFAFAGGCRTTSGWNALERLRARPRAVRRPEAARGRDEPQDAASVACAAESPRAARATRIGSGRTGCRRCDSGTASTRARRCLGPEVLCRHGAPPGRPAGPPARRGDEDRSADLAGSRRPVAARARGRAGNAAIASRADAARAAAARAGPGLRLGLGAAFRAVRRGAGRVRVDRPGASRAHGGRPRPRAQGSVPGGGALDRQ